MHDRFRNLGGNERCQHGRRVLQFPAEAAECVGDHAAMIERKRFVITKHVSFRRGADLARLIAVRLGEELFKFTNSARNDIHLASSVAAIFLSRPRAPDQS
jgi:hypothetical protein